MYTYREIYIYIYIHITMYHPRMTKQVFHCISKGFCMSTFSVFLPPTGTKKNATGVPKGSHKFPSSFMSKMGPKRGPKLMSFLVFLNMFLQGYPRATPGSPEGAPQGSPRSPKGYPRLSGLSGPPTPESPET